MNSKDLSTENIIQLIQIQWQDHFQTRTQTWKSLEIAAILSIALIGMDWKLDSPIATIVASGLLFFVAFFGMLITIRHRNSVERTKFQIIGELGAKLGLNEPDLSIPDKIRWWQVFLIWKSNTSLFILRMHFIILLFVLFLFAFRILMKNV